MVTSDTITNNITHINQDTVSFQVANKLLEFLLKLREVGYPSHLTDVAKNGLKCNVHADEADRMVSVLPELVLMQSSNLQVQFLHLSVDGNCQILVIPYLCKAKEKRT